MKILYIWDADYPWDIRVEKICSSLNKHGHEIHIASRNLKKLKPYEYIDGLHVHRIKAFDNAKINYTASFPAFFSPLWKRLINNIIEVNGINLIIVRDLPMAVAGVRAGKKYRIPVIFDMAEDYCAMLREIWRHKKYDGLNLLVRNPYLAKMVENYVIRKFDHILVVVDEAKEIVINAGGNRDKLTVIGNTPKLEKLMNTGFDQNENIEIIKKRYSAIYTGGITSDRGISVVIHAIPHILEIIPDFLFVVIGKGYETKNIMDLIKDKGLQKYVLWIGWVEHEKLYDYIYASKLGLIPHYVTDHTNTTIPNKIFDYMACGVPVIASDADPMKRIITEERCGLTFRSGNSMDLSDAIINIYKDKKNYGQNGIEAINKKYNWEIDEKKMLSLIDGFNKINK